MKFIMAFPNIQENFASRATKFTVMSAAALNLIFTPMATANAQDTNTQTAPQTVPLQGKHVTLRIGPGFSTLSAMVIRDDLIDQGCPATLHDDGSFDNEIDVEIGEDWVTFESAGSAGYYALTLCKGN